MDPSSIEAFKDDAASVDFLKNKEDLWKKTEKLSSFVGRAEEFDAVFYVGGHGRELSLVSFIPLAFAYRAIREIWRRFVAHQLWACG